MNLSRTEKQEKENKVVLIFGYKKANTTIELFWLMLVLFIILVSSFAGKLLADSINEDIQTDEDMHNITKTTMDSFANRYPLIMDNVFALALILIWAVVLIASYFVETHPIFFIFSLILIIFVLIVAATLGNTYEGLLDDDSFTDFDQAFPKIHFVMSNIVFIFLLIAASVMVILFAKR